MIQDVDQTDRSDDWVSLPLASRELGVSRYSVLEWALRGRLGYAIAAGRVVISRASVERTKLERSSAPAGSEMDQVESTAA